MNNNEKKVKIFLKKTAYGWAIILAAFVICSVASVTYADSNGINAKSVHILNPKSVHTLDAKPIGTEGNRAVINLLQENVNNIEVTKYILQEANNLFDKQGDELQKYLSKVNEKIREIKEKEDLNSLKALKVTKLGTVMIHAESMIAPKMKRIDLDQRTSNKETIKIDNSNLKIDQK